MQGVVWLEQLEAKHLYQQFFDVVYRICFLYMKQESDACDMAQETFLQLLKSKPQFDSEEKAKAWLIVTASNCCKTQLRKWWRSKRDTYDEAAIADIGSSDTGQERELRELVLSLEQKYSVPTYLYYFEGYRIHEISNMLGVRESTLQTRLARARELLKLELDEG